MVPESRKQHRVFLVHDELVIASSLAAIMRHLGFDARSFTNPLKALSVAAAEVPELLISDLAMLLLSGSELASQVREYIPDCKALLFSAQGMNGTLGNYDRLGQRVQILAMLRRTPDLSKRVNAENEFAY
jgi:DNA-binding NtrC family response regulator